MVKKFKKITLSDVKNNLAVILLLPALLGGLWQLLELSKMSISFIRFFSPTQLLPDGLLIMFMLGVTYIAILLGLLGKKTNFKRKIIDISIEKPSSCMDCNIRMIKPQKLVFIDNPIYENVTVWSHVILFALVLFLLLCIVLLIVNTEKLTFLSFIILIMVVLSMGKMIYKSVIILLVIFIDNKYNKIKDFFSDKPILKELSLIPPKLFLTVTLLYLFFVPFKSPSGIIPRPLGRNLVL